MKFEIKNRKGELKMENENQKPKLSFRMKGKLNV